MRRGWPAWGLAAAFALTCTAAASAGPAESGALRAETSAAQVLRISGPRRASSVAVFHAPRAAKERTSYVARARVRSASGQRAVCLQLRHVRGGHILRSSRSCLVAGRSWRSFRRVALLTRAGGGRIDVVVRQRRTAPRARFELSRLSLSEAPRREAAAPPPAAATAPAPALQAAAGSPGCDLLRRDGRQRRRLGRRRRPVPDGEEARPQPHARPDRVPAAGPLRRERDRPARRAARSADHAAQRARRHRHASAATWT